MPEVHNRTLEKMNSVLDEAGLEVVKVANTAANRGKGARLTLAEVLKYGLPWGGPFRGLKDGQKRTMRPAPWITGGERDAVEIVAHRVDDETPNVVMRVRDPRDPEADPIELVMSDSLTHDVVERLQRALDMLPSSK